MKVRLEEITGKALSGEWGTDDLDGIGTPVLRTTNFTNDGVINYNNVVTRIIKKKNNEEKYLRSGDIILEKSGGSDTQPVGRVVYYDGPEKTYLFNNFTGLLRVNDRDKWLPRYVFYALFSNYHFGRTKRYENRTTGLHNLQTDQYVKEFTIEHKPIDEQQRIVDSLNQALSIISLRKKQLQKLDDLIKARFIEMFGDPVSNPMNWRILKLGELTCVGSSKRIFEKEYVSTGVPFYRTKEIVELSKGNQISTELFITRDRYEEIKHQYGVPKAGDLLISAVGTIGIIWIVDGKSDFYYKDGNLLRVDATNRLDSTFMKYLLEFIISEYKKQMSAGTAYAALTISGLSNLDIYDVPLTLQKQFASFVSQIDKSKLSIQQSLEKLETLRKSLMQQYFG